MQVTVAATITRGAGSPHTQDAFYCHSQCYKTRRPIFCYCISTSSFHPLRFTPWLSQDQELQKVLCDLRLAQTRSYPNTSSARALSRASPSPRGSGGLGSRPAVTQCSCVNSEQAAGEAALGESTGGGLTGNPSPLQGCIPAQTLVRALQVCLHPATPTLTLPWWLKFWYYLGPTHHYRVLWWSPGSWLTLANIMNLLYPCLAAIPPHWQDHCPAFVVTLSFQPAFFIK